MGAPKILRVAWREFASTALTKAFIIGALLTPVLMFALIALIVVLTISKSAPTVTGKVAVIDPTGVVYERLTIDLSPEALAEKAKREAQQRRRNVGEISGAAGLAGAIGPDADSFPTLTLERLESNADVEDEKERIRSEADVEGGRLALVVVSADAIGRFDREPAPDSSQTTAQSTGEDATEENDTEDNAENATETSDDTPADVAVFLRPKLDQEIPDLIRGSAREAIRDERFRLAGYDRDKIGELLNVSAPRARELTEDGGERAALGEANAMIAYAFMMLMLIPVFVGAQYLLTSTIEEKSSRVVEVLLSAVSPMQLMTGKVLGQMFVGLVIMIMYGGLGSYALIMFSLGDSLTVLTLGSMLIFFALAYFTFASFMAAVGSSVNEMREAQSLLTPVMIPLMIPYALGFVVAGDPNSTFATVLSFTPPISPFMMMLRVASTEPPPLWQIGLGVAISAITCYVAVWFAAKVFRVGLLMYGKPPNFRTLIRWIRLA
ncbi:MAG: ABC transporter permease [Planctomycetota bacterium]